jgi:class 3 adenylate cyclase
VVDAGLAVVLALAVTVDTVNVASRMESSGVTGCIQVTDRADRRLRGHYRFERRGPIQVKGKGELITWFLVGRARQAG